MIVSRRDGAAICAWVALAYAGASLGACMNGSAGMSLHFSIGGIAFLVLASFIDCDYHGKP